MNETGATRQQIRDAEDRVPDDHQFNAVWIQDLAHFLVPDGHGIYRVADVEALLEYFDAMMDYANGKSDADMRAAIDRRMKSKIAITDDLLARCRREPR